MADMTREHKPHRRMLLTDKNIEDLPFAKTPQGYIVRDTKIKGFLCKVRQRRKILVFEGERRDAEGTRIPIYKNFGDHEHVETDHARAAAKEEEARIARLTGPAALRTITLGEAWESYRTQLVKDGRSAGTIADYEDKVGRYLKRWHGTPLRDVTRADVISLHNKITEAGHPYMANGVARVGHAIVNHAVKDLEAPDMPALNPFRGRRLHNKEKRRESGMAEKELPRWFDQVKALKNPIMRELHLMTLLTGLRRRDVCGMAWEHVNVRERYITIPSPKGGTERAFRAPLSTPMVRSLERVRRAGHIMCEAQSKTWVFPSDRSKSGHIEEPKGTSRGKRKDGSIYKINRIDKSPHALRHSFRGFAAGAGVSRTHSRILMNHRIERDIHDEYMSVPAMFDQLRAASEKLSAYMLSHMGKDPERALAQQLRVELKAAA
jgi:integrase